jgi:hypothetical protein
MALNSFRIKKSINLDPQPTTTVTDEGDMAFRDDIKQLEVHNGTSAENITTSNNTQTLTNKSISGSTNTLTNIPASSFTGQVSVSNGGTGQTTLTPHSVLIGEGTTAITQVSPSTAGIALVSTGASSDPTFSAVSLTVGVSGLLPGTNGGTGISSIATFPSTGIVVTEAGTETLINKTISGSSNTITNISLTSGVTGTLPIANGGTNAITSTAAYNNLSPMTTTGDIEYEASAGTAARLPIGSSGQFLSVSGGIPSWTSVSVTPTAMLSKSTSYTLTTSDDTVLFTAIATATLPTAIGNSGKKFTIINGSTTAANITIATTSSQTISGRVSSDIILTQYWDMITVESDGANYQIIDKQETTFNSTTGGKTITSASGAYQNSSPSLTLGIGKWRIRSNFHYAPGTSSSFSIGPQSGCFAADGADSGTPPTSLTNVLGATTFTQVSPGGYFPFLSFGAGTSTGVQTPFLDFIIYITSGTVTVHSVIWINYTSASGTLSYENYIEANRIW